MQGSKPICPDRKFRTVDCQAAAEIKSRGRLQYLLRWFAKKNVVCPTKVTVHHDGVWTGTKDQPKQHYHPGHAHSYTFDEEPLSFDRCSFEDLCFFCACVRLDNLLPDFVESGSAQGILLDGYELFPERGCGTFVQYVRDVFVGAEPYVMVERNPTPQPRPEGLAGELPPYPGSMFLPYLAYLQDSPAFLQCYASDPKVFGRSEFFVIPFRSFVIPAIKALKRKYVDLPDVPPPAPIRSETVAAVLDERENSLITALRTTTSHDATFRVSMRNKRISSYEYDELLPPRAPLKEIFADATTQAVSVEHTKSDPIRRLIRRKRVSLDG